VCIVFVKVLLEELLEGGGVEGKVGEGGGSIRSDSQFLVYLKHLGWSQKITSILFFSCLDPGSILEPGLFKSFAISSRGNRNPRLRSKGEKKKES